MWTGPMSTRAIPITRTDPVASTVMAAATATAPRYSPAGQDAIGQGVVEVKGFARPQAGTFTVPPNGPWTIDGEPAAVHTLTGLIPGNQVEAGVYATKAGLTRVGGEKDSFVTGLVVLVPHDRAETGSKGIPLLQVLPHGAVEVGSVGAIHAWAHQLRRLR